MAVDKTNFSIASTKTGTPFEVPSRLIKSIKQSNESLASEDSGRSDNGVMHIGWIKRNLRKWEVELVPCSAADVNSVLSRIQGKEYYVKIFDISANEVLTQPLHCYTSKSSADCYSGVLYGGLYQGVAFSIIEMGD